jgi:hypothetical protein
MRVGYLAHGQPLGTKARTFLSREDADFLVAQLIAERISQKLIRALPPNSFRSLSAAPPPKKLRSGEIGNCRYFPPSGAGWQETHGQAIRSVQVRAGMSLKGWWKARELRTA